MQNVLTVISLKNVKYNAEVLKRIAGKPLIAVVKDDAYGHGAQMIAHALEAQADGFAVASTDEGAALKTAGIQKDILVLTPPLCEEEVVRIAYYGLVATISSLAALRLVVRTTEELSLPPVRAHLAVNTGMNRYGFRPERVSTACRIAKEHGVLVEGVYSHYYAPESERVRRGQLKIFKGVCESVQKYFPDVMRHIAATGGTLAGGELYDAVRIGIGLYGYLPHGFEGAVQLKPAMKVYATVAQGGKFLGGGVGYEQATEKYDKLHTLRIGYGDGFARAGGIGIGKLCMDASIREGRGDFGTRRIAVKDLTAYAYALGTNEYEVLVNAGRKAVKKYIE